MILAPGARGPGLNSRSSPLTHYSLHTPRLNHSCLMVLLRKGSFSSNSCPSAVRAFSVLHPVCVLVRVLLVFDVRVLRFCLSLRFTRRRAAFYLRGRHREVNSTILTVSILMQGRSPSIRRDWPEAGQEDKLFGGLLFRRGWNSQFHQISEMIIR